MNQPVSGGLVAHMERLARARPTVYKLGILAFAVLGYAYIAAVVLLGLMVLAGLVTIALVSHLPGLVGSSGAAIVVFLFVVFRSLWVRLPLPGGLRLNREQAEPLLREVTRLSAALQAPRIHQILVTDEFNAGVVQHPRLGLLGWHTNYLLIGLPLMQALSADEFRAILTHEMGHLSRAHGRLQSWIYQMHGGWLQLLRAMEGRRSVGAALFGWFFVRYLPLLDAASLVLRRRQEYEADRFAADQVGPDHVAVALVKTDVLARYLNEKFWPSVFRRASEQAEPPSPHAELAHVFRSALDPGEVKGWLTQALSQPGWHGDSHPSLTERLTALGQRPAATAPGPITGPSAADYFFGSGLAELTHILNEHWRDKVGVAWRQRHTRCQQELAHLAELEARAAIEPLAVVDAWARAALTAEYRGPDAARALVHSVLSQQPDHPPALYALGRDALLHDDAAGIGLIERAIARDPTALLPGAELVHGFLVARDRLAEAEAWRQRAIDRALVLKAAEAERTTLLTTDTFLPADLDAELLDGLRNQLASLPDVKRALLVGKHVTHLREQPAFVLAVEGNHPWWQRNFYTPRVKCRTRDLRAQLPRQLSMPPGFVIVVLDETTTRLQRIWRTVPGSEIYRHGQPAVNPKVAVSDAAGRTRLATLVVRESNE